MGDKCGKGPWQQGWTHDGNLVRCHAISVAEENPSSHVGQVISIQLAEKAWMKNGRAVVLWSAWTSPGHGQTA